MAGAGGCFAGRDGPWPPAGRVSAEVDDVDRHPAATRPAAPITATEAITRAMAPELLSARALGSHAGARRTPRPAQLSAWRGPGAGGTIFARATPPESATASSTLNSAPKRRCARWPASKTPI